MSLFTSNSKTGRLIQPLFWGVLFFLLFDRGLFHLVSKMENNLYRERSFIERFREYVEGKNFSTLILGTSRTFEAIHPVYMLTKLNQRAYKEAQFGKNPKYNYYFYRVYKKYAGIPRVVIYGIDYFIFNSKSNKRWLSRFDLVYENKNYLAGFSMLVKYKDEIDEFLNTVLAGLGGENTGDDEKKAAMDFLKVQTYTGITPKKNAVVTERVLPIRRQSYRFFPGSEGKYLKMLLEELERDGVKVLLVIIPDYFGTYRTNINQKKFTRDIQKLADNYKNTQVLNFNKPDKFPMRDPGNFINGGWGKTNSHLSKKGAKLFNKIFLKAIKKQYDGHTETPPKKPAAGTVIPASSPKNPPTGEPL